MDMFSVCPKSDDVINARWIANYLQVIIAMCMFHSSDNDNHTSGTTNTGTHPHSNKVPMNWSNEET